MSLTLGVQLEVAVGDDVALGQQEDAVVVGPEQLGAVRGERARIAAPGETPELVGPRSAAVRVRERPIVPCNSGDPGAGGDEDRLLGLGERHRLSLRAVGERARQFHAEREPPRPAREDRTQRRIGAGLPQRVGIDIRAPARHAGRHQIDLRYRSRSQSVTVLRYSSHSYSASFV